MSLELPTAAVYVFQPIIYLVLKSIDLDKVSIFLKKLERYEFEVACKNTELPSHTQAP